MTDTTMTPREEQLLRYLQTYKAENGHAPSLEEIMAETHMESAAEVQQYLDALKGKESDTSEEEK